MGYNTNTGKYDRAAYGVPRDGAVEDVYEVERVEKSKDAPVVYRSRTPAPAGDMAGEDRDDGSRLHAVRPWKPLGRKKR